MPSATLRQSIHVGGLTISGQSERTAEQQLSDETSLPAAKIGQLTTRTDDNTGTLTMNSGHGITDGQIINIFWATGVQYNVTVGTVSTNSVPFDNGIGDNLPTNLTEITASVAVEIDLDFAGDDIEAIAAVASKRSHIHFVEDDDTPILGVTLPSREPWSWITDNGFTNPLAAAAVGQVFASNGDSSAASTLQIGVLRQS